MQRKESRLEEPRMGIAQSEESQIGEAQIQGAAVDSREPNSEGNAGSTTGADTQTLVYEADCEMVSGASGLHAGDMHADEMQAHGQQVYIHVYTYVHIYIHIYMNIHIYTYIYKYTYVHTYKYIHMYIYTYIYMNMQGAGEADTRDTRDTEKKRGRDLLEEMFDFTSSSKRTAVVAACTPSAGMSSSASHPPASAANGKRGRDSGMGGAGAACSSREECKGGEEGEKDAGNDSLPAASQNSVPSERGSFSSQSAGLRDQQCGQQQQVAPHSTNRLSMGQGEGGRGRGNGGRGLGMGIDVLQRQAAKMPLREIAMSGLNLNPLRANRLVSRESHSPPPLPLSLSRSFHLYYPLLHYVCLFVAYSHPLWRRGR